MLQISYRVARDRYWEEDEVNARSALYTFSYPQLVYKMCISYIPRAGRVLLRPISQMRLSLL